MQTISTEAGGPAAGAPRLRAEAILRSVRVVLFDAVGTLLFPDPPVAEAYFQAGRRHGSHLNRHEVRDRFQRSFTRSHQGGCSSEVVERQRWQTIVAEVFDDVPTSNRDALFQELWSHFEAPPSWKLFDDVPGVWDELRRRGKQLGIASNFDARLITLCRTLAPLDTAERVFCSSQVGYCKPDHRFFLAIQQQ
ncbi:MAG: HAD family hydrolase, partial [Pirellulaceae bacterium]